MDGDTKNTRILYEAALRPVSLSDKYDLETQMYLLAALRR